MVQQKDLYPRGVHRDFANSSVVLHLAREHLEVGCKPQFNDVFSYWLNNSMPSVSSVRNESWDHKIESDLPNGQCIDWWLFSTYAIEQNNSHFHLYWHFSSISTQREASSSLLRSGVKQLRTESLTIHELKFSYTHLIGLRIGSESCCIGVVVCITALCIDV
jgi:hypothetical protein